LSSGLPFTTSASAVCFGGSTIIFFLSEVFFCFRIQKYQTTKAIIPIKRIKSIPPTIAHISVAFDASSFVLSVA
jgi:hypothetical protein